VNHVGADACVGGGIDARQLAADLLHLGEGALARDTRLQPGDRLQIHVRAIGVRIRCELKRHPEVDWWH
jgi:hypothetical protein